PLVLGQVLEGMKPDSPVVEGADAKKNEPMMPVAWTKTYSAEGGPKGRVFTTTMGAATDLAAAGTRRMLVNACYWAVGLEDRITPDANVDLVGDFAPTKFGFNAAKKGLKPADMRSAADRLGERAIYVPDAEGRLATAVGAVTTTDVVVLGPDRTVAYHGAIDDQYGFGYSLDAPRKRYLADALAAIGAGEQPPVAATEAPGCVLDTPAGDAATSDVTYHGRISRIVARHCVECHRDGGVGPFPLDSFDDLVAHAAMVREVIDRGTMPPWFAAPTPVDAETGRVHTPWANDRSLAEAEKRDLMAWLTGGRPEGNPADAPATRTYPDGWLIGTPDAVFEFAEPVRVKATGVMPYQTVIVETHLPEDRWVQAIEVQPGDRDVVHHALIHLAAADEQAGDPRDVAAEERGGFWGEYVPGQNTLVYPDGFAKHLPKGARLRFQMHYTPNGTATTDRTRLGVIFAKEPPRHEVRVAGIVNPRIAIPPGAADHREEASLRLPHDATIMGFLPHLHVRGKACRYEVVRGDGSRTTLLDIPRYDFNWQLLYRR
ncbi:MAG: hypothetical protein EBX35_13900, partial [Planctomycetia bacterium]|nr:hypothetical protein [Planctomycetia bacterium]